LIKWPTKQTFWVKIKRHDVDQMWFDQVKERKYINWKSCWKLNWKNWVKNMSSEFDSFERLPFSLKLKKILSTQRFFIVKLFLEWLSYYSWNFLISLKDFQKPINWIKGLVIICLPSLFIFLTWKWCLA
jgi:hypothetical protein